MLVVIGGRVMLQGGSAMLMTTHTWTLCRSSDS